MEFKAQVTLSDEPQVLKKQQEVQEAKALLYKAFRMLVKHDPKLSNDSDIIEEAENYLKAEGMINDINN